METTEKKCSKCGEVKLVGEFGKNKSNSNGLSTWCKYCSKAYKAANKDKTRAYNKSYYKAYYESNKDKSKAYYESNKDKIKAYREANKDKIKTYEDTYREANRDKKSIWNKVHDKYKRENLTDSYVCKQLQIPTSQAEDYKDLIELKRVQLKIIRELKK